MMRGRWHGILLAGYGSSRVVGSVTVRAHPSLARHWVVTGGGPSALPAKASTSAERATGRERRRRRRPATLTPGASEVEVVADCGPSVPPSTCQTRATKAPLRSSSSGSTRSSPAGRPSSGHGEIPPPPPRNEGTWARGAVAIVGQCRHRGVVGRAEPRTTDARGTPMEHPPERAVELVLIGGFEMTSAGGLGRAGRSGPPPSPSSPSTARPNPVFVAGSCGPTSPSPGPRQPPLGAVDVARRRAAGSGRRGRSSLRLNPAVAVDVQPSGRGLGAHRADPQRRSRRLPPTRTSSPPATCCSRPPAGLVRRLGAARAGAFRRAADPHASTSWSPPWVDAVVTPRPSTSRYASSPSTPYTSAASSPSSGALGGGQLGRAQRQHRAFDDLMEDRRWAGATVARSTTSS